MRNVLIDLHDDCCLFLCTFFYGMSKGLPGVNAETEERKTFRKVAATNFRRVYGKLTTDEKIEVRRQIAEFEKCPVNAVKRVIDELGEMTDFLNDEAE